MAIDELICSQYSLGFSTKFQEDMVIGKLAASTFAENIKYGDEQNVIMPGRVTMSNWTGGDLNTVEKIQTSIVKVKVNKGKQVNFELEKDKEVQIAKAGDKDTQFALIEEYSSDARYQFRDAVDSSLGALYPFAGYVLDDGGNAITFTKDNAFDILAYMKSKFARGNDTTSWVNGKMIAIFPPEAIAVMLGMTYLQYTESQVKEKNSGFVTEKAGWKIYESNNIASPSANNYRPLFGVEGETLAVVIQKDMELIPYMRDNSLNRAYKGGAVYGVGAPRADRLGTANISVTLSL